MKTSLEMVNKLKMVSPHTHEESRKDMHTIYIFGLGPSSLDQMPKGLYDRVINEELVYLRTLEHPAARELKDRGLRIKSFDSIYEKYEENFEEVYKEIVRQLKEKVEDGDVYYGVPGHPAVAETTVQRLLAEKIKVEIIGGKSFIDDLFAAVEIDPINGFQLMDSFDLNADYIYPGNQLIIMQVFNSFMASEVKLALLEIYPAEHKVAFIDAAGSADEKVQWLPLYELDYFEGVYNLRSLYVPALTRDEAIYSFSTLKSYMDEIFGEAGDVWAKEQTGVSLLEHFQEELDELKEAYKKDDLENVVEELGDLLMQIFYQAALGEKEELFSLEEIVAGINQKLRRRHPHVFDNVKAETPEEVDAIWQAIKEKEKRGEI